MTRRGVRNHGALDRIADVLFKQGRMTGGGVEVVEFGSEAGGRTAL